jgi:hypothetical protein
MSDLLQRARDIAADQYIRMEIKRPNPRSTFIEWSAHVEKYAEFMREGRYDHLEVVQTALAALRSVAA